MKGKKQGFISDVYTPVKKETLTPLEFKKALELNSALIKTTRFIPPSPSKKGFGFFEVEYFVPMLKSSRARVGL